jgi:hypothetical protein
MFAICELLKRDCVPIEPAPAIVDKMMTGRVK